MRRVVNRIGPFRMDKRSSKSDKQELISVIIPALNEERALEETLLAAVKAENIEIIVSDGGSKDETLEIAGRHHCMVVSSPGGRGIQLNRGAKSAKGDIFLFLHADTILPERWDLYIRNTLSHDDVKGGAFSFKLSARSIASSYMSFMVNMRSKWLKLPYGDQGIFLRRDTFEKIGGFRDIPIMEDVEMVSSMRKLGRLAILDAPVVTSSRRWEKEGWIKTTLRNQILLYLYLMGIAPEKLYKFYRAVR